MARSRYGFPRWFDVETASDAFCIDLPAVLDETELSIQPDGPSIFIIGETFRFKEKVVDFVFELVPISSGPFRRQIEAFIHGFFVSQIPPLQGRGIATQCLRQLLPYLYRIGVRTVTIPLPMFDGKTVWPKFGFRIHPESSFQYIDMFRTIYADQTGETVSTAEIDTGPGFLEDDSTSTAIAKITLEALDVVMLELDLNDEKALTLLNKRVYFYSEQAKEEDYRAWQGNHPAGFHAVCSASANKATRASRKIYRRNQRHSNRLNGGLFFTLIPSNQISVGDPLGVRTLKRP